MKIHNNSSKGFLRVEQVNNNITSWIGEYPEDNKNVVGGQTFIAMEAGVLESIEVIPNMVMGHGKVKMTFHSFDPFQRTWGPVLGNATVEFDKDNTGKWVVFNIPGVLLEKDAAYGFKIESPEILIGVGEAVGNHSERPFANGQEWQFTDNKDAESFSYFSLAFKVDLKAA